MQNVYRQILAAGSVFAMLLNGCNDAPRAATTVEASQEATKMTDTATTTKQPAEPLNVKVGDSAPDFTMPMSPAGSFTLSEKLGKETVVLYFYPMDDTPGCTAQACSFRDRQAEFAQYGAAIYGVSKDSLDSHAAFAGKYELTFPLLMDEDGALRTLFGMPDPAVDFRSRLTYVIDKQGVVRHIVNGGAEPEEVEAHITQALEWARKLADEEQRAAG